MTKRIVGIFLAILFVATAISCNNNPATPDPSIMQTYVAGTIQADIQATSTPESFGLVWMTATPGPTNTPVPTLVPRNLFGSIIDDIRLNDYCNQELVPEIIKKLRLMYEEADSLENPFQNNELNFMSTQIFTTEADQQAAINGIQALIDNIDSTKIPECLVAAKTKLILGYEEVRKAYERNDENWFSDLLAAGAIAQSGWDELDRIEQCLPTGCR